MEGVDPHILRTDQEPVHLLDRLLGSLPGAVLNLPAAEGTTRRVNLQGVVDDVAEEPEGGQEGRLVNAGIEVHDADAPAASPSQYIDGRWL